MNLLSAVADSQSDKHVKSFNMKVDKTPVRIRLLPRFDRRNETQCLASELQSQEFDVIMYFNKEIHLKD